MYSRNRGGFRKGKSMGGSGWKDIISSRLYERRSWGQVSRNTVVGNRTLRVSIFCLGEIDGGIFTLVLVEVRN